MSDYTKIQWCHSTVNPLMGCGGCELFPSPREVLASIDSAIGEFWEWEIGRSKTIYSQLIREAFSKIVTPLPGHSSAVTTTNIWHLRELFYHAVEEALDRAAAKAAEKAIAQAMTCYETIASSKGLPFS